MGCSGLFKKHDWKYVGRYHRICKRCAMCSSNMVTGGNEWRDCIPFDSWLSGMELQKRLDKRSKDCKRQAWEFVKNF